LAPAVIRAKGETRMAAKKSKKPSAKLHKAKKLQKVKPLRRYDDESPKE
jgi:hypothetical protein